MPFLPLRAPDDITPRFIGLDLAKKHTQLAALDADGFQIASTRFETSRENFVALRDELTAADVVILEVTTNAIVVARLLARSPARVLLSNPVATPLIAKSKFKTDKIDAFMLAFLGRNGDIPAVWLPDPDTEALRHLMSDRRSIVDRRTELKNTVHSILHRNLIAYAFEDLFGVSGRAWLNGLVGEDGPDTLLDGLDRLRVSAILLELDRLESALAEVEGVIAAFIVERPHLRAELDHLLSIPGVSLVVGAGLLAAIGDVRRFGSAKQLASYFGLVPPTHQTGKQAPRHGRITKAGRSEARWLAVEAAEHLRKAPGPMRALYSRVAAKRGHNVAVVAVARKLTELVWQLLTRNQDFLYEKPRLTMEKRARVRWMARRRTRRRAPSASPRAAGQAALYGSGLQGRKLKGVVAKRAAEEAEAIYAAIVAGDPKSERDAVEPPFDPTRPRHLDWQRVLEAYARKAAGESDTAHKAGPRRRRTRATSGPSE